MLDIKQGRAVWKLAVISVLLMLGGGCESRYIAYQQEGDGPLMINEYAIVEKTIPAFDYVNYKEQVQPERLADTARTIAKRVFVTASVQDIELVGPLTLTFGDLRGLAGAPLDVSIGFPAQGDFTRRSGVEWDTLPSMRCLTVSLPVDIRDLDVYWAALIQATYRAGYAPNGEFRSVLKFNDTNTGYLLELQVGV